MHFRPNNGGAKWRNCSLVCINQAYNHPNNTAKNQPPTEPASLDHGRAETISETRGFAATAIQQGGCRHAGTAKSCCHEKQSIHDVRKD